MLKTLAMTIIIDYYNGLKEYGTGNRRKAASVALTAPLNPYFYHYVTKH